MNWRLPDGNGLNIKQETGFPWSGEVRMTISPATPAEFTVYVRIPGWSQHSIVKVNGKEVSGALSGEYLPIRRRWSADDRIDLSFDMTTRLLESNPAVAEDRGRVAFQRGPIVFCMERLDQPSLDQDLNLSNYAVDLRAPTTARFDPDLLDGVMVLEHPGTVSIPANQKLYFAANDAAKAQELPVTVKLIPYYAWANRAPAAMQVWIPYRRV
jgi:DUF1680 family protein